MVILLVYSVSNQYYYQKVVEPENYNIDIELSEYINERFPGRNLYISHYPSFHFEKVYYFVGNKTTNRIKSDYPERIMEDINRKEKYVVLICNPAEFAKKYRAFDPAGNLLRFSDAYSLFHN